VLDVDAAALGDRPRVTATPTSPALYVLDPFVLFRQAVGVAIVLGTTARLPGGPCPSLTAVGVGYPTGDLGRSSRCERAT
jgi:hypothetical protein